MRTQKKFTFTWKQKDALFIYHSKNDGKVFTASLWIYENKWLAEQVLHSGMPTE